MVRQQGRRLTLRPGVVIDAGTGSVAQKSAPP